MIDIFGIGTGAGTALLGGAINVGGLIIAIPLLVLAMLFARWYGRRARDNKRRKPGQYLRYAAPGTAAKCRGLLEKKSADDLFEYTLEPAQSGGWYIHFTGHRPTGQALDTLFLLQFEGDEPAEFSLTFTREAFGMKEPVLGEALLDEFFAQKLGAERLPESAPMV